MAGTGSKPLGAVKAANLGREDTSAAACSAAMVKVESVIQRKETRAEIEDVSEEIFLKLQKLEGWEKLRCVLCFQRTLSFLVANKQKKGWTTTLAKNTSSSNTPFFHMKLPPAYWEP